MEPELAIAQRLHQGGRHADAARRYRAILARDPLDAEALHLFGVMHHQCGYPGRAVELIGEAVALRPAAAAFHTNLAEALRALGRYREAAEACHTALRLQPDSPEASNNLGLALHELGQFDSAAAAFRQAVSLRPAFAEAHCNLGTTLRALGCSTEALMAFRAAVQVDPSAALFHANLGQMLIDAGLAEEALGHCRQAVLLAQGLPAAHHNLGNALRALARWEEARAAYTEALRLAPNMAMAHANLAMTWQAERLGARAGRHLQCATELAGDDVEVWRVVADVYILKEEWEDAVAACDRVVALRPDEARNHATLGWAHQESGQHDRAAACYHQALEQQTDHLEAHLNLGTLNEELGDFSQAENWYRRALLIRPASPLPLSRLAALRRDRLPDDDLQAIRDWLENDRLDSRERLNLLFGLAQVLDARGEHDEAAACLQQGNALALERNRIQGKSYDIDDHRRYVDSLIDAFRPELFSRLAGAGDDTRMPVFIFGLPRSGTTLVEQVLASHSRVHGAGELRLVRETFDAIPDLVRRPPDIRNCLDALDAAGVRHLSHRCLEGFRALCALGGPAFGRDRVVDKMLENYLFLGLLALLFPRATLIYVRRDLRDSALSCWMANFRSIRWANDPDFLASRFREHRRIMDHWRSVLPVPIHEVVYEELVDDFEPEARRLVAACGLDWEPACLEFHRSKRPVRTASVHQVRQPLYRKSLARWKGYERALADLFARLPQG